MQGKPNRNRKGRQAERYIYIPALDNEGCVVRLLLTEKEYLKAKNRAKSNPEDTFGDVVAFQVIENKVNNKICDIPQDKLN